MAPDERKIEDLEDELRWGGPSSHWANVRFFTYCADGCTALALAGIA
jgi:hypothetical protein